MTNSNHHSHACPLCNSEHNQPIFEERGYPLVACDRCDLFFIQPYPDPGLVHDRVKTDDYHDFEGPKVKDGYQTQIQYFHRYFPIIKQEVVGATSFLDLGCGPGRLLELLRCFPDLYRCGVELNIERAEWARKVAGCEIVSSPLEEMTTERKFDVIAMINVLSHIPSFDSLFLAIKALLAPEGKLILKVGELGTDVRKWAVRDWHIPDHLHFLGLGTISHICQKYDFKTLRYDRIQFADDLFSKERWRSRGKSRIRNIVKGLVVNVPLALPVLKKLHQTTTGTGTFYSSFIVLTHN